MAPVPDTSGAEDASDAVDAPLVALTGTQLLVGLRAAAAALADAELLINELNVFPVPDGDTGSNMRQTFEAACAAAAAAPPQRASAVMDAAAHGALMGARGNSGVILSQVIRGLAHGFDGADTVDAALLAGAFEQATAIAYAAVINPIEGTILTVIRRSAAAVAEAVRASGDMRTAIVAGAQAAYEAVDRTIDQLPMLREAGVVDAGGVGFAVLVGGFCAATTGVSVAAGPTLAALHGSRTDDDGTGAQTSPRSAARGAATIPATEQAWGFCTEFIIEGPRVAADVLRALFASEGDSLVVAGDGARIRVHIHTDAPDELIAIASRYGSVERIKVEDMSAQHHAILAEADAAADRRPRASGPRRPAAIVPVAAGAGFTAILRSLGADQVVGGGQTMNPSTEELLDAVYAANADTVILLPNNGNIVLSARQVQRLADGVDVRVLATRSLPQGISALLSWDPGLGIDACLARMQAAAERTRALEITRAVRNSRLDEREIRAGEVLAILDGEITGSGASEDAVILEALRALVTPPEFVTIYRGAGTDAEAAGWLLSVLESAHPTIGFELHDGGQDHYSYVLGLE
jgi:DAK2 domain fusion protein YloV